MVLSRFQTSTLALLVGMGAVLTGSAGHYTRNLVMRERTSASFYRDSLKILKRHPGALHMLGEPIRDQG